MDIISASDREILRNRAKIHLEFASDEKNAKILKMWENLQNKKRDTPTVRLLFSNFVDEVITPRLTCEGEKARQIEAQMLSTLVGRELFDDDTPLSKTFDIAFCGHVSPFGANAQITRATGKHEKGFHIDPLFETLEEGMHLLEGGDFSFDEAYLNKKKEVLEDVFGDILPCRFVTPSLGGSITNPLVHLMGMENYYIAMLDEPDELHHVMDMATSVYERYYDYLEEKGLLCPTHDVSPIGQESFAFNNDLPKDKAVKTTDCWGFLESQETTAVSRDTFGEFVFPYQDRLVKRFGLLSYGCCETVEHSFEYFDKWKNLRKLSVSPFNNERNVGEKLRGTDIIYYSKPRAEFVTNRGPIDEDALEENFKMVCESASGCLFEVAQREVGTIFSDIERGKQYVNLLRKYIQKYWKP